MKRRALVAASVGFGVVAGLLLAEAVLRAFAPARAPSRNEAAASGRKQASRYVYRNTPWFFPYKARPTELLSMTEPFSEDVLFGARHNSSGFRTAEYTIARPPDTFRIVVLGDSVTWGQGVSQEQIYPVLLEARLRGSPALKGARVQVISLSVCGHRAEDNYIKLLAHAQSLHPDLVVLSLINNDLEFRDYGQIRALHRRHRAGIFKALRETVGLAGPGSAREWLELRSQEVDPTSVDWRDYAETLDGLQGWSRAHGVPFAVIAFPTVDVNPGGRNFAHYAMAATISKWTDPPLNEVRRRRVPILDLMPTFRDRGGDAYLAVSPSDGHPNALAHRLAAEAAADFLRDQGLISAPTRGPDPLHEKEAQLRRRAAENWLEYNASYPSQVRLFDELAELYPADPWVVWQRSNVLAEVGRQTEAFAALESLLGLVPAIAAPWHEMAGKTNDQGKRRELLERMLSTVPDFTPSMEALAPLLWADGAHERACRLWVRVAEIPSYEDQLVRALGELRSHGCEEVARPAAATKAAR